MEPRQKEYPYPAGYEHIAEQIAGDVARIRGIDTEIERLHEAPENGGPKPQLTPTGAPVSREPTKAEKTAYLNNQKAQIQKESFERVDKEVSREKDPTIQRVLRDAVRNELYGNPYDKMDIEQLHAARQQQGEIDLEQSANYMDAQRGRPQSGPVRASAEPPSLPVEQARFVSPSYQAAQSLTYTRMTEKTKNASDKSTVAAEPPQNNQEPEKPLLPSEVASLSLNYTVMTQQANSLPDPAPDKALEPTPAKDGPDLNP